VRPYAFELITRLILRIFKNPFTETFYAYVGIKISKKKKIDFLKPTNVKAPLNTVTYGLACAPFLAMRALRQLAADERSRYPEGASVLLQDTYMDDILFGADTMEAVLENETT